MPSFLLAVPVFLPILAGLVLILKPDMAEHKRNIYTFAVSIINLVMVVLLCLFCRGEFKLIELLDNVGIVFTVDGLGRVFAVLVSVLWPFSLLYGYEYMEHEERRGKFFGFFIMTLGSVIGIAFSADLLTLYIFYEILTLLTFPLVMHTMTEQAMSAGKSYLVYMLGGAAFAFVGMMVLMQNTESLYFTLGGVAISGTTSKSFLVFVFFMMFCGFSVKAAMMPFGKWLISAAVAPMPVTALLHAVAVVKAGAFAVIRLIYYIYGVDYVRGTWAQYAVILLTSATILYGSVMAVKEPHLKRRMAYSTISNLSYVLFGAALMTPLGLVAALAHLIVHAVTKIGLFFSVGAVMHVTDKEYIYEIDGLGRKMKWIFAAFTITACSLIGVPQFAGFISKMRLLTASIDTNDWGGYVGAFAILLSALLTAVYLLMVVIRAYFPQDNAKCDNFDACHDPGWRMLIPIYFSVAAVVLLGICWEPLLKVLTSIAGL